MSLFQKCTKFAGLFGVNWFISLKQTKSIQLELKQLELSNYANDRGQKLI